MQRLVLSSAILFFLVPNVLFGSELIHDVDAEVARGVIERNEMQYEEIRWHSFPGRTRIATIQTTLLREPGAEFTITPFDKETSVQVRSNGFDAHRWTGVKTYGGFPEDILRAQFEAQGVSEATAEALIKTFNIVEFRVQKVLTDRISGEPLAYGGQYRIASDSEELTDVISNVPVFASDRVREIDHVSGEIHVFSSGQASPAQRTFSVIPLQQNPEYVVIYEQDTSKNHFLMESPSDPEAWARSEQGQRYEKLREEKAAYLEDVAKRIADRSPGR